MGCLPLVAGGIVWAIAATMTGSVWIGLAVGVGTGLVVAIVAKRSERRSTSTTRPSGVTENQSSIHGRSLSGRGDRFGGRTVLPGEASRRTKRIHRLLREAHLSRRRLTIRYETGYPEPGDSKVKIREVEVYSVGKEYFDAYCYYRSEVRTFRVSRVLAAQLTDKRFQIPASYAASTWVTEGSGEIKDRR